ncbi:MAG: LamG domain-containing protein [Reichenbachiella sp.]
MKITILTLVVISFSLFGCGKTILLKSETAFNNNSIILDQKLDQFQFEFPLETGAKILLNNTEGYNPIFNSSNTTDSYTGYYYQVFNGNLYFGFGNATNKSASGRFTFTSDFKLNANKWYNIKITFVSTQEAKLTINGINQTVKHSSGNANEIIYSELKVNGSIGHYSGNNSYYNGSLKKVYVKK